MAKSLAPRRFTRALRRRQSELFAVFDTVDRMRFMTVPPLVESNGSVDSRRSKSPNRHLYDQNGLVEELSKVRGAEPVRAQEANDLEVNPLKAKALTNKRRLTGPGPRPSSRCAKFPRLQPWLINGLTRG